MVDKPKIFVIIVTYKGQRWYDKCFGSLRESTIPLQVIAVDNTPGDEDATYIKEHFPEVHLIKTSENLGFGRANNLGMRYALDNDCDYVFLLNQDAWIEPDTIMKLVEVAVKYPDFAIYSPMHMSADKQHLNFLIDDGNRNYELLSDAYTGNLKEIYTTNYVNAAAWLLPRKTLETLGGFCPLIYHYGEDDDYIHRVHYHKMSIGIVPAALIVHDSKHRLGNSKELADRAKNDDIDTLLDINNPRSLSSMLQYFRWKSILSWFRRDKKAYEYYSHRCEILISNKKQIDMCRTAHMIKQPNWL